MNRLNLATAALVLGLAPVLALAQSAIDGAWKMARTDGSADSGWGVSFKTTRNTVTMSAPTGASYVARLDGTDAPFKGDSSADPTTSVSVTMPSDRVLVEVAKRNGQPWLSTRMEVDASGKTAQVTWNNLRTLKGGSYDMVKQ